LIQNDERLREERKKAKKNKDKYQGMSGDNMNRYSYSKIIVVSLSSVNKTVGQKDDIRNPSDVGFSHLVPWYKQSFTIKSSKCSTVHFRVIKELCHNCKSLYPCDLGVAFNS
jgi:hypothetical protein